jgi:NhaP-type Na+/H+ or K+/H+ antiporter/mannitol/fructose-specific phosphotransferase system IIA component (Ntr-type)
MHTKELLTTFSISAALGVCLFTVANYLRTSAIVVLLVGGVIAGPECLGLVNPQALGDGLGTIISLSVAIILFEGGLTLDLKGYRSVSKEIIGILTIGVLVTWLSTAVLLRLLFRFDLPFCFLAASLIIVTGPTVIGPLLHRIRVKSKLHHILHWEGVLIDPIGVFIALLSFEYFVSVDGQHQLVFKDFFLRFAIGVLLGVAFGFLLDLILRRQWVSQEHTNVFVLVMAMLNFCLADLLVSESGLLSVTVAGLVLGSRTAPQLRGIIRYKVELKDLLIGLLFVLLAANLDLHSFLIYGWQLLVAVAAIMLIIRPFNVFASTRNSSLTSKEKLFLCWIAPRGIVAASMASVFTLRLAEEGVQDAVFLETFTYSVIAGTVIVQGFTAGIVGRWLGVVQPVPTGWIIVGAHSIGRQLAKFFARHNVSVVLIDTNSREVRAAKRDGFNAIAEDALQINPDDHVELYNCGNLLAFTSNAELNELLCRRWEELIDGSTYRWENTSSESEQNEHLLDGTRIWQSLPLNRWMQPNEDCQVLRIRNADDDFEPDPKTVLLTWNGKTVIPGTPKAIDPADQEWLVFETNLLEQQGKLPLSRRHVLFTEQSDLLALYREMLMVLQQQNQTVNAEQLIAEMWSHEEEFTSLVGNGIAIPHARAEGIVDPVLIVARPRVKIACPLTGHAVELIFMLISPIEKPDDHLRQLANIARLVGTQKQRDVILQAESETALYDAIKRYSR